MNFILQAGSSDPLYRQVRRAIEEAMASGRYPQALLPSSRALALELGVSRTTVNLAFQELVADGYIVSEPRVGYRINSELLTRIETRAASAPAEEQPTGLEVTPTVDWSAHLDDRGGHRLPQVRKDYEWERYPFPFIYGQVPTSSFPVASWNRALRTAMDQPHIKYSLRDAGSADDPLLVQALCTSVLPSRGIRVEPDQVLITAGAQQGLFLSVQALLRPHDVGVVENPGYPDVAHILDRAGARIIAVDVDAHGVKVGDLPTDARLISVTPSHQFPTNVSLAVARRQQLLEFAARRDAFILEDDYDSEFRFVGRPSPALRASGSERVVYIGSFSKFLAPGLRIGFVVGEAALIQQLRADRRYSVRHLPGQIQRALALMIESGDYQRALRRHRSSLREKWKQMAVCLRGELGSDFDVPTGGTSMWVRLPVGADSDDIAARAARSGILVESGTSFFLSDAPDSHRYLRLAYAAIPLERIRPGIDRLFEIVRQHSSLT